MSETIGVKIDGLTDREAITDAIYRAANAYDLNQPSFLDSAATEDCVFEIGGHQTVGLQAIKEGSLKRIGPMNTGHLISNVRIDIAKDGKTANATASALANHFPPGDGFKPDSKYYFGFSTYNIQAVKQQDDTWKISFWKLNVKWFMGDPSVMGF